jgi:hypothetical protein
MKFISFSMHTVAKVAEVAQASDKVANTPGQKILAKYTCLGKPFDGMPPNTMVTITIHEAESHEAMAAYGFPMMLAGSTVWAVPVLEMPAGNVAAEVKKLQK